MVPALVLTLNYLQLQESTDARVPAPETALHCSGMCLFGSFHHWVSLGKQFRQNTSLTTVLLRLRSLGERIFRLLGTRCPCVLPQHQPLWVGVTEAGLALSWRRTLQPRSGAECSLHTPCSFSQSQRHRPESHLAAEQPEAGGASHLRSQGRTGKSCWFYLGLWVGRPLGE